MMLQSGIPLRFWFLACSAAVFVTNRCWTKALPIGMTPFESWYFRKPSVSHIRVFGCQCFRLIRKELRHSKFSEVSSEGVLVGFDQDNFNYLVYNLGDKKIYNSHHVMFNKHKFPFLDSSSPKTSTPQLLPVRFTFFDDEDEEFLTDELESQAENGVEPSEEID